VAKFGKRYDNFWKFIGLFQNSPGFVVFHCQINFINRSPVGRNFPTRRKEPLESLNLSDKENESIDSTMVQMNSIPIATTLGNDNMQRKMETALNCSIGWFEWAPPLHVPSFKSAKSGAVKNQSVLWFTSFDKSGDINFAREQEVLWFTRFLRNRLTKCSACRRFPAAREMIIRVSEIV
jgi:hypothetical protein